MTHDIIIPLSDTSRWYDIELKYALRSFEKYIDVGNVFIIGLCPSWLTGVIHIPYDDIQNLRQKEKNIAGKVLAACRDERVSDDFIFANDDHFLLAPWEGLYEHGGSLAATSRNPYAETVKNTLNLLGPCNNFDIHCPIVYNKQKFVKVFKGINFPDWGYCIKTIYCVKNGIEGVQTTDLKIESSFTMVQLDEITEGRKWTSCGDIAWDGQLRPWLNNRFSKRSRWEKEKVIVNQNY